MRIFDRFFKKEKEGKKEEREVIGTCIVCNKPVYKDEEYRMLSFQNQKYPVHLKCFRKAKKMAKRYVSGGFKM